MRILLPWAAMLAFVPLTIGVHAASPPKAAVKKPAATTAVAGKAPAKKAAAAASTRKAAGKPSPAARKGRNTAARQPAATWRNRQNAPSPDRYREIQSALAAKGYLPPEDATGEWNQGSIDALKRFQSEQSLQPTGKLNSLSLIALGLGPRYEAKPVPPPAAPAPRN